MKLFAVVKVYYNLSLLALTHGYRQNDPLQLVFEGAIEPGKMLVTDVCDQFYALLNGPRVPLTNPRSMSVGDVVYIQVTDGSERMYACADKGWTMVEVD